MWNNSRGKWRLDIRNVVLVIERVEAEPKVYRSLNTIVTQLKNCPFAVNTTTELKNITATSNNTGGVAVCWDTVYNPEGCGFDSRLCHWNFSLTWSFLPHYGLGVVSASIRNGYHEYFLGYKGGQCVGLTTLPLHVPPVLNSESLNLLEPSGPVEACTGIA
jgi:hypothetical protein